LALAIVEARGETFSFLPAMAFTVVLVTNLFIVWGAIRAGSTAAAIRSAETRALEGVEVPMLAERASAAAAAGAGEGQGLA
ncbi:MAG TPA: hypothetical protein VGG15_09790, partial [Terriglobales bacterium]